MTMLAMQNEMGLRHLSTGEREGRGGDDGVMMVVDAFKYCS